MIKQTTRIAAIALLSIIYALPATAQDQQEGQWTFKLDVAGVHQSETDLTDGGFAVDRWFISAGADYSWDPRKSIGFSVGGGKSSYEFDGLDAFGGGNPWNKIEDARVSVSGRFGLGTTGMMFVTPTLRFNGEKGSGDDSTYGLYLAAAWRLNENLTIGPGMGVFSRLEDGARIFPLLALDWDITERLNLSTGRELAVSQGPGLTLSYQLNDDWSLGLAGRYEDIEFRLDDEGPAAGGVGRDQSLPIVITSSLKLESSILLTLFAGLELDGTLKLKDATGVVIDESSYDPAPIFGGVFEIRF
jgi:hypothetical protein